MWSKGQTESKRGRRLEGWNNEQISETEMGGGNVECGYYCEVGA